jgi:hypothetical protein
VTEALFERLSCPATGFRQPAAACFTKLRLLRTQLRVKVWEANMQNQWVAMEHYRLHVVEEWPDSPYKQATLAAIQSTLTSLSREACPVKNQVQCTICASRKRSRVLQFMDTPRTVAERTNLAA